MPKNDIVLVVDDEDGIRMLMREVLQMSGYEVVEARSGEEAVEVFRNQSQEFAVVLLDVGLPGIGGKETAEMLVGLRPDVKIVLSTGYARSGRTEALPVSGVRGMIEKPFQVDELLSTLERVIGGQ